MSTKQIEGSLVDAIELRRILEEEKTCCERSDELLMGLEIAIADLSDVEPVGAANVTLCKDCDYWKDYRKYGRREGLCTHLCVDRDAVIATTNPYDYCSHGLRRDATT